MDVGSFMHTAMDARLLDMPYLPDGCAHACCCCLHLHTACRLVHTCVYLYMCWLMYAMQAVLVCISVVLCFTAFGYLLGMGE